MREYFAKIKQHPVSVLSGTLLLFIAFGYSAPAFAAGKYDSALVDLALAGMLIYSMCGKICSANKTVVTRLERIAAWVLLGLANVVVMLPGNEFFGNLLRASGFALLLYSFILYFCGIRIAGNCVLPVLWCLIFIPFHEELMLMASYPLRLSATAVSAWCLKGFGVDVLHSGSSLHLPGINIAITDACSGINQLDAFLLIAYIMVKILHKKDLFRYIHFLFIIPSVILGNTVRIVLTVLLYQWLGEVILERFWHIAFGYGQIILALLIFLAIGKLFSMDELKKEDAA